MHLDEILSISLDFVLIIPGEGSTGLSVAAQQSVSSEEMTLAKCLDFFGLPFLHFFLCEISLVIVSNSKYYCKDYVT